jgi:peptidoglycan/xylan/chitin deacetylase (PgdA/CDA1 family)
VKRIALEGHELGNHSFSHPRFQNLTLDQARSQLSRTEAKVVELTGLTTRPYFRFPYGWRSNALIKMVNEEGYLSVSWTFDSLDSDPRTSCETIRSRVSKYACPGAIVLMHCGSPQEAQVIPTVIEDLKAAGYEIVTVTEVLSP